MPSLSRRPRYLDCYTLPAKELNGSKMCLNRNLRFVSAALNGRDTGVVAEVLCRLGMVEQLFNSKPFQPYLKQTVRGALQVIQEHWTARHAVFLMSEVHTSRSEFETLRHLLSYVYDRELDYYERICVWVNPCNPKDSLHMPTLAAREPRERERASVYEHCGAAASADGLYCGRVDFEGGACELVAHYWDAIDPSVKSGAQPLLLVFTGDATGGWRGDSITHGELGIGSWAAGKGVSKSTLLPLFLMEGEDSATNLRNRAAIVADGYNKLKKKGKLVITVGNGEASCVNVKLLCAADFQFFKAIMNMSKYTSAIWCFCSADDKLFSYPDTLARTWSEVLAFYSSIGCVLKDLAAICELNHYSLEVLEGRPFKEFTCRCGWKSGCEREWRAAVDKHTALEGQELKAANLEHSRDHYRHYPFSPPLLHQPAIDYSADVLHLIFINIFTTFFEMTILNYIASLSPAAREPFEVYIRSIGVPMKVVKAESVADMKQALTGRDAKVIVSNAIEHVPTLLEFAHTEEEEILKEVNASLPERRRAAHQAADEDGFDWDGDEDGEADDNAPLQAGDDDDISRELRDAMSWDAFLLLCYSVRPFERDDQEYRQLRAVECFNAAAALVREYKRLVPNAMSACPHVALCVLPRQMVEHGDPGRRATDQSESFGASIKDGIHRRCLRRKLGSTAAKHTKRNADGSIKHTWLQRPLSVSRVMQAFRDISVREKLLRHAESAPFLQRKHFKTSTTGFVSAGPCSQCDTREPSASIAAKLREGRDLA